MDFKKILDDYMKQLDCTAKDLAESSGLSAATISRYRSGNRVPEDGSENFDRLINGIISIAESKGIPDITVQSVSDAFSPYVRNNVDIAHLQKNFHTPHHAAYTGLPIFQSAYRIHKISRRPLCVYASPAHIEQLLILIPL